MNEAALPRMVGKKRKPPGKVFTLQQLCSPSGDRPATSPELRALLSGSRPQSREGDLEGWLKNAFAAQHVAVKEALSKHQLLIMQELLGPMDVSPSSVAPNFPNEKPVPLPGGSPQHMISEKAQGRMLHPVEPEAPPLPPMPPLPNQLLDDGPASPFSKDTLDTASDGLPKASALEVKPKEGDTGEGSRPLATLERHVTEGSRLFDQNRRASTGAGAGAASKLAFRRADEILDQLKMPFWHPGRIVRTTQFDAFICAVIMLNTLMMAFESQYLGLQRGYDLGFPRFTLPASEEWPYADLGFYMADYVFGVIYLVEICIKIAGLRCEFFKDGWNYFDSSLVLFWIIEKSLSAYAVLDQGMLRVLRMGRVLRLLRLVKTIQGFDALYIMTTAMQGSVTVLFWSFVLLMVVQTLIAFTLNQALDSYFRDQSKPVHQQHQVFLYFGTTGRAMFTMFELTLANWPTAARVLQENVTEYYAIFSVAYKLVIGFAAVGIINAVFMQETFKVAASDDKLMMRQKERDRMLHTKKMRTLFAAADESGDGVLDQDEFREIMTSPDIRTWLAAQELPIRDPDILWQLLDDGDAELTADELVTGVERLKGTAKGIDLAAFILEHRKFQNRVCEKLGLEIEEDDD